MFENIFKANLLDEIIIDSITILYQKYAFIEELYKYVRKCFYYAKVYKHLVYNKIFYKIKKI